MNDYVQKRAKKREKEIKEARFVVKWSPVFWFVGLVLLGCALDRCLAKPGLASYLRLLVPIGFCISWTSMVQKAKAVLRDPDAGESMFSGVASIVGSMLVLASPLLPETNQHGQAYFGILSTVLLVTLLLCGFISCLEYQDSRKKRGRLAALRAAANNPTQPPTEPTP